MLEINGAVGESGGQILRTAVALAAVTQIPIKVVNIRAGRAEPGLKVQHLNAVDAVAKLCNAKVTGLKLGSTEVEFVPGEIEAKSLVVNLPTAASITLVLQALTIACAKLQKPIKISINGGGTVVAWSPPIDYFQNIYCDYLERMGILVTSEIIRHGFYPRGGAQVKIEIKSLEEKRPFILIERGKLLNIKAWAIATKDLEKANVAERMLDSFQKEFLSYKVQKFKQYVSALSPFAYLYTHALFESCKLGSSSLGERGKSSELVGREAALELTKEIASSATVDKHMADQLIPFLGLFGGCFVTSEITNHTKTNIWVTEKFVDRKFKIEDTKIQTT